MATHTANPKPVDAFRVIQANLSNPPTWITEISPIIVVEIPSKGTQKIPWGSWIVRSEDDGNYKYEIVDNADFIDDYTEI